jgi:hypothetical protein
MLLLYTFILASEFDYDTETGLTRPGDTTDDDATLMPPPSSISSRRSSRIRKQPTRFNPADDQRMNDVPIKPGCRLSHKNRGCGAFSVGHMPRYYNSLRPVSYIKIKSHIYIFF